ncbi:MAG TPA: alcohol dehydrogenase catalytic domain-containing protein [Nitrososphaeraceae archaeon]|nr:alcohol dehydrogenase catalytic domain-containing protein [Nitrososphaeraceae archaeon]
MRAALFYGPNDLRITNVKVDGNQSTENIMLKTLSCSVCSYDVRTFRNGSFKVLPPVILGHEICAITIHDYESSNFTIKSGTRVSVYPVIPCLNCWYCLNKKFNLCSNLKEIGSTLNGGFAEYISIPRKLFDIGGIVPVPDNVSNEQASLVEPLACCINGINQIKSSNFESAFILGDGPIGLMQLMLLKKFFPKMKVVICGKIKHRLDSAKRIGADLTYLINEKEDEIEVINELKKSAGLNSPNLIFVSNNSASSIGLAAKMVNKNGKIVIFSGIKKSNGIERPKLIDIDPNFIHYNQISIHGSFSSNPENFREAMNLLHTKEIILQDLVTNIFSLKELENALLTAESFHGLKSIINKF